MLYIAVERGDIALIRVLLFYYGADATCTSKDGSTTLYIIHPDYREGVNLLVKNTYLVSTLDRAGNIALHVLTRLRSSYTESLKTLIYY